MRWYEALLLAAALLASGALVLWLHVRFWVRRLGVALGYSVEERIATSDGAFIELRRLPAPDRPAALPPMLLVHGVGANHRNNDLTEDTSLARHLSALGRDVWLLTLRSGVAGMPLSALRRVRFAAMVRHDLPLAVEEVLRRTRASALDYVGFSMGGMLLYAALGHSVAEGRVRRVGIIGSPAVVRLPLGFRVPLVVGRIPALLFPTLRLRLAARAGAFACEWWHTPAHHWVFNPKNVAPGVARLSLINVIEDIPGPLNRDFAAWAATPEGRVTVEGTPVLERMGGLTVPVIFFAGAADRLAPPEAVRSAFEAWGAEREVEKCFVLLGREHGASADYGHGDLAVGSRVREELFEPLAEFMSRDAGSTR